MTAAEPLPDTPGADAEAPTPAVAAVPDLEGETQPEVDPGVRMFAKASLVALAHGVEASLLADEPDEGDLPVVLALFQREEYFDSERRRYRELARNSLCTLVGFVDEDPDVPSPVYGVPLIEGEPLASEFALIIISKCICVSLIGEDNSEEGARERDRLFKTRWSFDRATAITEARRLIEAFGDRVPEALRPQIETRLDEAQKAVPRRIEARLTASFEQMVDKYEKVAVRLHALQVKTAVKPNASDQRLRDADPVSGALTRAGLAQFLGDRVLTPSDGSRIGVVWIDVDGLEEINSAHGREAGDAALKLVAETVQELMRAEDCLARWTGDEFIVVLPGMEVGAAKRRAEEFVEAVSHNPLPRCYESTAVSISCGVAIGDVATIALERLRETSIRVRGTSRGRTIVGDYLTTE